MENEKKQPAPKTEEQANKRSRHNRRRGYFIEPASAQGAPAAKQPQPTADAKPQSNSQGHGGNPAPKPVNTPQKQAGPADNAEIREKTGNKSNRNRRRNRHKSNKPQETQGTQQTQAQINQPKKESTDKSHPNSPKKDGENKGKSNKRRGADKLLQPSQGKPIPSALSALNESDYEEVTFPAPDTRMAEAPKKAPEPKKDVPLVEVVGIRFKSTGKVYYFSPGGKTVKRGEHAIVETARGQEFGEVSMGNTMVKETDTVPPLRTILRVATEADIAHHKENKQKEEEAFKVCNEKILSHKLDMKLIDAQYTFDNSKLLFYFTSSGRVDFRDLVKDLAGVFRTRIELRQIGIRDEAKLMGGMGMCGRSLCCTLFLSDFGQVSIKMAKEQNLSLNSAKISGICGRLMCCLRYEHETYDYEIKRTPPVDSLVRTADGNGIVTEMNPLAGTIKVRLLATPETPPKVYRREDVTMLQKKKSEPKSEK